MSLEGTDQRYVNEAGGILKSTKGSVELKEARGERGRACEGTCGKHTSF